ncbi:hypothetical protein BD289DRAFT_19258 [Coniella lustricola]|uniref:GST N-terminal domain-containing protein n=1 Tax=Coniella lustricola TaxID=2025994 RepID=A0A2T3AJE9_9PEZI|nr:hypothetical protein BD289DRAFT_19258 [Coniella lustricola]
MSEPDYSAPFTLYYGAFSLWSTMVRTTLAFRGAPLSSRPEMNLQKRVISIAPSDPQHLSEEYLTKINPKGLVPALVGPPAFLPGSDSSDGTVGDPVGTLSESAAISYFIAEWYPSLLPKEHEAEIRELMTTMRQINFAILTFGVNIQLPGMFLKVIEKMVAQDDISAAWRERLEAKKKNYANAPNVFTEPALEASSQRASELFATIQSLRERYNTTGNNKEGYIFSATAPTLLDAHILCVLARVSDAGRSHLIPPPLLEWVEHFRQGEVWKEILPGNSTLPKY